MAAIQEPYEISIWEDKYNQSIQKYEEHKVAIIGTDTFKAQCSALEPVLTKNINGTSIFTFKMLRECYDLDIIESLYGYFVQHNNENKALAVQPDITPLIYRRIQVYDDHYINPFIQYLFNEQKLKVKWKGKWYDFIIKNCDESSDSKLITYTCEDQFISELSRQGFNLTYDIELQNNIDTAPNLVTDVLKGTDWSYDAENSDTIREYVEEPVYEATTNGGAGVTTILENGEGRIVLSGYGKVMLFYSQASQLLTQTYEDNTQVDLGRFGFYYVDSTPVVEKDGMLVINGVQCYVDNFAATYNTNLNNWSFHLKDQSNPPYFTLSANALVSTQYRAQRIVNHIKSRCDPLTNRVCQIWQLGNSNDEIYRFTDTDTLDCTAVNNLILNSEQFTDGEHWYLLNNGSNIKNQPSVTFRVLQEGYKGRSWFKQRLETPDYGGLALSSSQYLWNNTLKGSTTYFPNGLVKGQKYIVSYELLVTDEEIEELNDIPTGEEYGDEGKAPLLPHIYVNYIDGQSKYHIENSDFLRILETKREIKKNSDDTVYEESYLQSDDSSEIPPTFKVMIWTVEVEITESVSKKTLFDGFINSGGYLCEYGFMFSEYAEGGSLDSPLRPYIFRFYPKIELQKGEENTVVITPDNVEDFDAEPLVYVRYNYYNHTEQQNITDIKDLAYLYQDKVDWINPNLKPVYLNFERQATISAKQSNRFNILQTIAEQFKCWVQFIVDHKPNGEIKSKQVRIKKGDTTLGANLGYGFVYGIDLKSIKRNIKSNALSTKTIVLQNSNEFGTYGFCAIGRAQDNTSGADYILNFDYYISKGLIDRNQLTIDMYGPEGLYTVLSKNVKPLDAKLALKQSYITEKEKFLALYNTAKTEKTSAEKQIISSKERIRSLARDAQISDDDNFDVAVFNYINKQKTQGGGVSSIQSEYYKYKNAQDEKAKFEAQYVAYGEQISKTGIDGKLQNLEAEIKAHKEAISNAEKKFYESYSRFIQEGTWNDEKYYDDNLYYLDALQVAYTSARPEVSYTIDVFRVGALEEFKGKDFDVGDITFIEDTQYFGYDLVYGVKTPHKEPVYIYEITYYFEEPEKDVVKVQNYKTQFEDLFQRITAKTQSLQFTQGSYARAANLLSPSGELNAQKVQEAIQANQKISGNMNNILQDGTGYTVIDKENPNIMTKLTSRGLCSSTDGGVTWTKVVDSGTMPMDALQTGVLNANKNPIVVSYNNNRMGFGEVDLSEVPELERPQGPIYGLYGTPYLEFYYNSIGADDGNEWILWRVRIDVNNGITFCRYQSPPTIENPDGWIQVGQIPVQ